MRRSLVAASLALLCFASSAFAIDLPGFSMGEVQLKSAGPLAFAPDNTLIVGDPKAAMVYAIQLGKETAAAPSKIEMTLPSDLQVADLAVSPDTGAIYLSVNEGGEGKIMRVDGDKLTPVSLDKVSRASAKLANAPEDKVVGEGRRRGNPRDESITDLAYVDNQVIVTGRTSGQASAGVHAIAYPFREEGTATSIEIYHAAHGRYEDSAVARVFVPFTIDGKPHLLAGFTCTPLVKFPLGEVAKAKSTYRGTTVAELGNRNRPLDMIVYEMDGKQFLLMANSARGVMKVSTDDIEREEGLTEPVRGGGVAGQDYEAIEDWKGVVQLDKLNDTTAVIITQTEGQPSTLKTVVLP